MEELTLETDSINVYNTVINSIKNLNKYITGDKSKKIFSVLPKIYASPSIEIILYFIIHLIETKIKLSNKEKIDSCILLYPLILRWLCGCNTSVKIIKIYTDAEKSEVAEKEDKITPLKKIKPEMKGISVPLNNRDPIPLKNRISLFKRNNIAKQEQGKVLEIIHNEGKTIPALLQVERDISTLTRLDPNILELVSKLELASRQELVLKQESILKQELVLKQRDISQSDQEQESTSQSDQKQESTLQSNQEQENTLTEIKENSQVEEKLPPIENKTSIIHKRKAIILFTSQETTISETQYQALIDKFVHAQANSYTENIINAFILSSHFEIVHNKESQKSSCLSFFSCGRFKKKTKTKNNT
jgi:hypothetical protein